MLNILSIITLIDQAQSERDYFDISLKLVRFATPQEVASLATIGTIKHAPFKEWVDKLYAELKREHGHIAKYRHRRVLDGISFYSNGGVVGEKSIIVCFCTSTHDLCLSISVFLQYFPESKFDVLVLRDMNTVGFTHGIQGFANSLPAALDRLRVDFELGNYKDIRCFGASSGGAVALFAGSQFDASLAVCVCGRPPTALRVAKGGPPPPTIELENALRDCRYETGNAIAVFGEGHSVDAANAQRLADLMELTLVPVPDISTHVLFRPLLSAGKLGSFLESIGLTRVA